jgi:hypothetical protein
LSLSPDFQILSRLSTPSRQEHACLITIRNFITIAAVFFREIVEEAMMLVASGKRSLLINDMPAAVNSLGQVTTQSVDNLMASILADFRRNSSLLIFVKPQLCSILHQSNLWSQFLAD